MVVCDKIYNMETSHKEPLPLDPKDPTSVDAKLDEILAPDGPLVDEAEGDAMYLDLLQRAAVQDLAILVYPEREDIQEARTHAQQALIAYENRREPGR